MRTVKDADIRKQEILDGAIRVFASKSYDQTTITDIAKELNISQGLCYRYFPSKEAIYDAALEKYASLIAEENLRKTNLELPIRELIDQMANNVDYSNAEKGNKELYQLFHTENSQKLHNELFLQVTKKVLPYVQERLRKAKETGEIAIDDPGGTAIIGMYGWVGMYLTEGLTNTERLQKIHSAWYQLLGL